VPQKNVTEIEKVSRFAAHRHPTTTDTPSMTRTQWPAKAPTRSAEVHRSPS
jgi:hypothetical protein